MDEYNDLREYVNKYIFFENKFVNTLSNDEKLIIELFCGSENKKQFSIPDIASIFGISIVDVIKKIEDIIYKFHSYKLNIQKTDDQIEKEKRLKKNFPDIDEQKIKEKLSELSSYQRRIFMMYYGISSKVYSIREISDIENKVQGNIRTSLMNAKNRVKELIVNEKIGFNAKNKISRNDVINNIGLLNKEEKKVVLMYFIDNMNIELIAKNTNHLEKTISKILNDAINKIQEYTSLEKKNNISRKKELIRKFNTEEKNIVDRVCYLDKNYREIFNSYYGINCTALSTNDIKELYDVDKKDAAYILDISEKIMRYMLRKSLDELEYESKNLGLIRLKRDYNGYDIDNIISLSKKLRSKANNIFNLYYGIGCKAKEVIVIGYENNIPDALIHTTIKRIRNELINLASKKYIDDDINKKNTYKI